jgi:hypothetical protein
LDDAIILQTDGTVIGGLLILLTVAYVLAPRSKQEQVGEFAIYNAIRISKIEIITVAIFSASAILVTSGNVLNGRNYAPIIGAFGRYAMMVGFGSLALGLGWLLYGYAKIKIQYKPPSQL